MLYHAPVRNLKFAHQVMSISPLNRDVFDGEPLALSFSQAKCEAVRVPAAPIRRLDESNSSTHAGFHRRRSKVRISDGQNTERAKEQRPVATIPARPPGETHVTGKKHSHQ